MLPESLHSSYEQYKADTDIVASWLAITARQYGYTGARAQVAVASKGPKLRGRERKLARDAAAKAGAPSRQVPQVYRIKAKEFVPLAQFIANSKKPRIDVPSSFKYHLVRAIKQRQVHQNWHQQENQAAQGLNVQDGHARFIETLEQVYSILQYNIGKRMRLGLST